MEPVGKDRSKMATATNEHRVYSITFADDGKQVLSGGVEGMLRRWRLDDGRETGSPIRTDGAKIYAVAVSPDGKRLVCGLKYPESNEEEARVVVWDAQTQEKVLEIRGHTDSVLSVHVSPDSTKLATGGSDKLAFIWSLSTGEPLVGPLEHDGWVVAVRLSPNGDRIATATAENPDAKSIRIYDSENGQQLLDIPFAAKAIISSPLAWSADGGQLFAVSYSEARCFDTSSGSLLHRWTIPDRGKPASVALTRNGKLLFISSHSSLSFWDASTFKQIGIVIKHTSVVWSIALSPDDDCITTGEENGKITFRSLRGLLPSSYFPVKANFYPVFASRAVTFKLPFISISDVVFRCWTQGDFTRVEELLTEEIIRSLNDRPLHQARLLAYRAIARTHMKRWNLAVDDVTKSIEVERSVIAHIANALIYVGDGDHESAMRVYDLVFTEGLATENNLLLLIKAIILFECGQRRNAISRVDNLVDVLDDRSLCTIVRAQMFLLFGTALLKGGDNMRAMGLFGRAQESVPLQTHPHLAVISFIFGWDFDSFDVAVQQRLQECFEPLEGCDGAISEDPNEAVQRYSTALSLSPRNRSSILVHRSKALAALGRWEDALKDADEAVKIDPQSPWVFQRKHAALHGLQRYDEAIDAFSRMLSLIDESPDPDARQLGKKYVSPSQSIATIDDAVRWVSKIAPLVLIDVTNGRLCDEPERMFIFKSEPQFKELVSSMTQALDGSRIQHVVRKYFLYVTFSHVWEGKEPLFQEVKEAGSIWKLDSSSDLNQKLQKFCEVVRGDGYRWAWSDTCCIDKSNNAVLSQSLTMMYKWYEASAATFVFLMDVELVSVLIRLKDSKWMTRAWTSQELLAPKAIRFYDRNWKPYLGDTRSNHKESPEIMQELADAIGVARETIIAFNPDDLSVREKLRLASTRNATMDEDIAYSLIGIFKSDIIPRYGERDAALGHLLEEIVARSGEVTVLAWAGKSSSYNSCLPATLAVYSQPPSTSFAIEDDEMDACVAALKDSLSQTDAIQIYSQITQLPAVRFANRRLHLPCITFGIKRFGIQGFGADHEYRYRARVSGIGGVEFDTSEKLPLMEPHRFIFVHPWLRDLRDPFDGFAWGSAADDEEDDSDGEDEVCHPDALLLHARPAAAMDDYTRALRLIARLQQPFQVLLLRQELTGEFKRVAAEHEIVVSGVKDRINFAKDVYMKVVEVL